MNIETITSAQNPKIKELLQLQEKSKVRREKGLFIVEGRRELGHCIEAGYKVRTFFVCKEIISQTDADALYKMAENNTYHIPNVIEVPSALYKKIAYREGTEGIIAEMEYKTTRLEDIILPKNPLIVVLESVEKPGNLGAVLRSADAAKVDAVIVCDPRTDLYNPNLIRSSIGAIFTTQTAATSSENAIKWLKQNNIQILTAQLQDSVAYYDSDMKKGTAIVMGTESTGLTDIWRKNADSHIRIPMLGKLDSLNVSVSASILMYEAVRQRNS